MIPPFRCRAPLGALLLAGAVLFSSACTNMRLSENPVIDQAAFVSNPPHSIALLPFKNSSGFSQAADMGRETFLSALASLGYDDVELDDVDSSLSTLALEHEMRPEDLPLPLIRQANIADALLEGEVVSVSRVWLFLYSHNKVRTRMRLIDNDTGKTMYENEARGTNMQVNFVADIVGLVTGAVESIWHLRPDEMRETFQEFSERVARSFPPPSHVAPKSGVYLRNVKLTLPRDPLQSGDALSLEFEGTPGKKAFFDLGNVKKHIRVAEIRPGVYGVRYIVRSGMVSEYCVVKASIEGENDKVEVPLHKQPFRLNAAGVAPPDIEGAELIQGGVRVRVVKTDKTLPLQYTFFRSTKPEEGYLRVGEGREPFLDDTSVQPGVSYYYRVSLKDQSGRESDMGDPYRITLPARDDKHGGERDGARLEGTPKTTQTTAP